MDVLIICLKRKRKRILTSSVLLLNFTLPLFIRESHTEITVLCSRNPEQRCQILEWYFEGLYRRHCADERRQLFFTVKPGVSCLSIRSGLRLFMC